MCCSLWMFTILDSRNGTCNIHNNVRHVSFAMMFIVRTYRKKELDGEPDCTLLCTQKIQPSTKPPNQRKRKKRKERNTSVVVRLACFRFDQLSTLHYTTQQPALNDTLLLYCFLWTISLPAAKTTSTHVFGDWPLIPSNPRMRSRSFQGDTVSWVCNKTKSVNTRNTINRAHPPIYQNQ